MKKLLTLIIPCEGTKVLLGMKKRGFGRGRWNGFGGKVLSGETIEDAALRELNDETGLVANVLIKLGVIEFSFENTLQNLEVHIFKVDSFIGSPQETEEMSPNWFEINEIPFNQMWSDDEFWFPYFLSGKLFRGKFHFDKPADSKHAATILNHKLSEVKAL